MNQKLEALKHYFGYDSFREGQEELIDFLLSGRDVLGVMPTGGGKSICYQLPALLFSGITLVISPLISLMKDQVMALKTAGVPAAYINSSLTPNQFPKVYENIRIGKYKIIYIAPERLEAEEFLRVIHSVSVSMVAVDEAHCISEWGQDFRPGYLKISRFVQSLPVRPVMSAFTATATKQVQKDIREKLALTDPFCAVTGFDRPNLYFEVMRPTDRLNTLVMLLRERADKNGIVYCLTRKQADRVYEQLKAKHISTAEYHAGLTDEERKTAQEDFIYDRVRVMVATNAFGMGIDKSNVAFVIHYGMPLNLEEYYQEAGRAGRDGSPAECILLYAPSDYRTAEFLIENTENREETDEVQKNERIRRDKNRLYTMLEYCKTDLCLRGYILEYFSQPHEPCCENCKNCRRDVVFKDVTEQAKMIFSCVLRLYRKLGYYLGKNTVVNVLRGSREKRILELGLDTLSTYGLMKEESKESVNALMDALEAQGFLQTETEYSTLQLTKKADEVLFSGLTVTIKVRAVPAAQTPKNKTGTNDYSEELFEALRTLRLELAQKAGVPAYVIFSNATLQDMARKKPRNMSEFLNVTGVGEQKARLYGYKFLSLINR